MRDAVRNAWLSFTAPMEGKVNWMYLDVKGLCTTGYGNLIDPIGLALDLRWNVDGRPNVPAASHEIVAEWHKVKGLQAERMRGGGWFARHTTLRLDEYALAQLVFGKLDANDTFLRTRFPEFESWSSDAQLATHSLAWACGPSFRFEKLDAALRARDWADAARECRMDETGNPGLKPRNIANRVLFQNADRVYDDMLDPDVLYWPRDLTKESETRPDRPSMAAQPITTPDLGTHETKPVDPELLAQLADVDSEPEVDG